MARHKYNIIHQYTQIRLLKDNLLPGDIIVHADFSENYLAKYSKEIQSVHFGASQKQITLITGMLYFAGAEHTSFCSISDSTDHSPAAIWAHMEPILKFARSTVSDLETVHFITDGPTTQYRNKYNFLFLTTEIYKLGFKNATWNFLEAGYGKGAADGIGSAIKRQADSIVNVSGKDITSGKELFERLHGTYTSVNLFLVNQTNIDGNKQKIPSKLKTVPNTMKIHQVMVQAPGKVNARDLSCFCSYPDECTCFNPITSTIATDVQDVSLAMDEQAVIPAAQAVIPAIISTCNTPVVAQEKSSIIAVDNITEDLIGKFCVVVYDQLPYPGEILDIDTNGEEVEVKVMHKIGKNRFFWPMMDDILWYKQNNIVTLIEEPSHVTKRHCELKWDLYSILEAEFNI